MMLSTTTQYALRIMVVLADAGGRPLTSDRIASITGVPPDYAVKVLQMLARAELVLAQRGRGGGFRLHAAPEEITLLDVVNAIAPLATTDDDGGVPDQTMASLNLLRDEMNDLVGLVRDHLGHKSLATMIEERHQE